MNRDIAIKWLKQALHDLEMSEKNIGISGYDVSAFLAHQAVEKLFKSIFALEGQAIPRIHYIDELAQKLKLSGELLDEIAELTVDYTFSRYPDVMDNTPYEEYDEEIAKTKLNIAKKVFAALKDRYKVLLEAGRE